MSKDLLRRAYLAAGPGTAQPTNNRQRLRRKQPEVMSTNTGVIATRAAARLRWIWAMAALQLIAGVLVIGIATQAGRRPNRCENNARASRWRHPASPSAAR